MVHVIKWKKILSLGAGSRELKNGEAYKETGNGKLLVELSDNGGLKKEDVINVKTNVVKSEGEIIKGKIGGKEGPILVGLNNVGATCYMSAALQCLSNTEGLTKYFLTEYKEKPQNKMANEYYKLVLNLWNRVNNNGSFSPINFKKVLSSENPSFAGIAANDSKDLMKFLSGEISSGIKSSRWKWYW